jgi:spermidine/putrescine transport system substrate-binding protein
VRACRGLTVSSIAGGLRPNAIDEAGPPVEACRREDLPMDFDTRYRRLLERYGNGDLDRRRFLGGIARTAIGFGITGPALLKLAGPAAAATSIRYDGYGGVSQGAMSKLVLQPYAAKSGATLNQGSYGTPEELIAKIQAEGPGIYNYCNTSEQGAVLRFLRLGLGVELDEKKIPRLSDLIPRAVESYRRLGNGKLPAVPFGLAGGWMGYNRDKVDRAEVEAKGFNILVDPKYQGQITGQDFWMQRIFYAARQSGQDPNAIKDMNAVWDRLRESKRLALKYWRSSAEQMQLFSSGSALVGDAWFVPGYNLKKQGVPFETYPKTASFVDFGSFMVMKGAPLEPVYEMMDILLRPETMVALGTEVGNVPLLDPRKHPMPPEVQRLPGYDPTGTLDGYFSFDPFYWGDNADAWQREFRRIMARS